MVKIYLSGQLTTVVNMSKLIYTAKTWTVDTQIGYLVHAGVSTSIIPDELDTDLKVTLFYKGIEIVKIGSRYDLRKILNEASKELNLLCG